MSSEASAGRWVDHVGLTVPNVEEATRFFEEAFGATIVYDTHPRGSEPIAGPEIEQMVGIAPGSTLVTFRMLQLPHGPGIELFEYSTVDPRPPLTPADVGVQHFAVYVDDIDAACERIERAGGRVLAPPADLPGPESGAGNKWCYTRTPWDMTLELISVPTPMAFEATSTLKRWHPDRTGS